MKTRRQLLVTGAATVAAAPFVSVFGQEKKERPRLKKAVKIGMVRGGSFDEKFALLRKVGFQGVEMASPGPNDAQKKEAREAAEKHGVIIHGVVDATQWKVRNSDPDPQVRANALADLTTALRDAQYWGADTVLLVPGKVNGENETYDQVWERSTAQVKQAIPVAEKSKVKIAIEVVWNDFITKPEQMIQYVDQFKSPWVGAYFDCSNMLKYGVSSAEWIRKLGRRMLKFDFKGFSIQKARDAKDEWAGFKVGIGEGDENWPEILKALNEIGYAEYSGWATAEVGGGDEKWLRDVSERMDKILGLAGQ